MTARAGAGSADRFEETTVKIAWLANVQPPYREPMWRELAAVADLEVSFFFRDEETRHFTWRDSSGYRSSLVRSWRLPLPSALARRVTEPFAILWPGVTSAMLRGADALVIHVWCQPANVWAAVRARLRRIPYLIYAESTLQSRQFAKGPAAWMRSVMFRHAGAVIVPGPAAAEAVVADGTPAWRVVQTTNSVDLELFDSRVRELRADRLADRTHRFVCIGQLIERKNVGSLIRALFALDADATLDVAGDGVELAALTALARDCGIGDKVRFHGFLDPSDVLKLLARTHTLVLPSTEEVYGYTALEAYVAGLQVIVSERAGIAANLVGLPGSWVVDPTVEDLRRALDEAHRSWKGWRESSDDEFASPRRAALDILEAVEIAQR